MNPGMAVIIMPSREEGVLMSIEDPIRGWWNVSLTEKGGRTVLKHKDDLLPQQSNKVHEVHEPDSHSPSL